MPIYEYKCPKCGKELETMQKFDDPAPICPTEECQEGSPVDMVKQVSQSSFRLKGGGWYADGYQKVGKK